jgi:hypothetical protein
VSKSLPFTEMSIRRAIAAVRKEGIVVAAVAVHPDGTVTIYQQGGIAAPVHTEQNHGQSKWLDVEA